MAIEPTSEQIRRLRDSDLGGAVVMLNLLRYPARRTDGGNATKDDDAYRRYGRNVQESLTAVGATVLWQGRVDSVVIGDDDADAWDEAILVEYPSRAAFLEMAGSPRYNEVARDRTSGLLDSRLLAMTELRRSR